MIRDTRRITSKHASTASKHLLYNFPFLFTFIKPLLKSEHLISLVIHTHTTLSDAVTQDCNLLRTGNDPPAIGELDPEGVSLPSKIFSCSDEPRLLEVFLSLHFL